MLENLADLLRENPRASACLVAREQMTFEIEEEPGAVTEGEGEEAEAVVGGEEAESAAAEGGEEEITGSAFEFAERWKDILVNKHGIEAHRVVVLQGKQMQWSANRLTTWLVPEKAPWPNPFARDEDEPEEEEVQESAEEDGVKEEGAKQDAAATKPPPF
jgi:hypothetical protein